MNSFTRNSSLRSIVKSLRAEYPDPIEALNSEAPPGINASLGTGTSEAISPSELTFANF